METTKKVLSILVFTNAIYVLVILGYFVLPNLDNGELFGDPYESSLVCVLILCAFLIIYGTTRSKTWPLWIALSLKLVYIAVFFVVVFGVQNSFTITDVVLFYFIIGMFKNFYEIYPCNSSLFIF